MYLHLHSRAKLENTSLFSDTVRSRQVERRRSIRKRRARIAKNSQRISGMIRKRSPAIEVQERSTQTSVPLPRHACKPPKRSASLSSLLPCKRLKNEGMYDRETSPADYRKSLPPLQVSPIPRQQNTSTTGSDATPQLTPAPSLHACSTMLDDKDLSALDIPLPDHESSQIGKYFSRALYIFLSTKITIFKYINRNGVDNFASGHTRAKKLCKQQHDTTN